MDSPTTNGSKETGTFPKVRELIKEKKKARSFPEVNGKSSNEKFKWVENLGKICRLTNDHGNAKQNKTSVSN